MANHKLFEEFPSISSEEWRKKIDADLKGADFDKKLVWKTIEGFKVQPYYRQEDIENNPITELENNQFPYVRGQKTENNDWLIRQDFEVSDIDESNKCILDALMKGVTSINIIIKEHKLDSQKDFDRLMRGIELTAVEVNFCTPDSNADLMSMLANYMEKNQIDKNLVSGSFNIDPLAFLTLKGKCGHPTLSDAYSRISELITFADQKLPNFHIVGVNGRIFPNAGSSIVQELAYAVSMANTYLAELSETLEIDTIAKHLRFNMGVSSNYFMEIAKVRALRYLWSKLVAAYEPKNIESAKAFIHAETSKWNKTAFDAHVNMLRTTTESMSASIGGVDSLTVSPYDVSFKKSDAFSNRIARNTQILLKEEAHFDKVIDPAAGSYYIEELTQKLIDHSWELVLKIEDAGGYYEALKAGTIQKELADMAQQRDLNIATRREVLLGTNQYPNAAELMKDKMQEVQAETAEATEIEPIKQYRGAEAFEALRFDTENAAKTPKVFMFTYGNVAMRRARSQFIGNFFGCAGYEINDNNGFSTVEEGIEKAKNDQPEIVVVCSSDDEYATIVPQIQEALGEDAIVVVAGYPTDSIDELKAKGIEYFIHVKTNVLETLQEFNDKLLK